MRSPVFFCCTGLPCLLRLSESRFYVHAVVGLEEGGKLLHGRGDEFVFVVGQADGIAEGKVRDADFCQRMPGKLRLRQLFRQDRDAEAGLGGGQDCLLG